MNCVNHPETPATAFCRSCGRPLCSECQRPAQGSIYCEQHVPAASVPPPPTVTPALTGTSPGLAFVLGLIPGVGAIYNGQYAKGLIHVVIFGLLISIASSGAAGGFEPLFGMLIAIFYFYMPFEAYHTARRRQLGQPVDEFSSLLPRQPTPGAFPAGPVLLIALGVLFLLNNLDILRLDQLIRYWPVLLIALGGYMLYCRLAGVPRQNGSRGDTHGSL